MHGIFNRSIERFVRDTYGWDLWMLLMRRLDLGFAEFEAMLTYDDEITVRLLVDLSVELGKERSELLEDIGTYLVSHRNSEAVRRLLRFSGVDFVDFLYSLDDLPARAKLALSDIVLPELELREVTPEFYRLTVHRDPTLLPGFGHVAMGMLRAMADDYGALVFLEYHGDCAHREVVEIRLLAAEFAAGRDFELAVRTG